MAILAGAGNPQAERLVSSGGNIYTLYSEPVRAGVATRGRGFWVGKKRKDQRNPDVDNPMGDDLDVHAHEGATDDPDDGFDDNRDPMLVFQRKEHLKHAHRAHRAQARSMVEAASGQIFGKGEPCLAIGGVKVDLLLQDPRSLAEEDLVKSAVRVRSLIECGGYTPHEGELLRGYAGKLAGALRKAIFTKPTEEKEAEAKKKTEAKKPPKKAQEVKQDANGKTQYKYPKKDNAKGPQSDGAMPEAQPGGQADAPGAPDPEAGPQVSAPPKIDPTEFCNKVGIPEQQLQKLANKKTRAEFVRFFTAHEDVMEKYEITPTFLGTLYDSMTHPEPQEQEQPQQQQPKLPQQGGMPGMPPLGKSLVVFSAGTLHGPTLALMDLLKSHKAKTVNDIQKCLQTHYATTEDMAMRTTRTLLNQWECKGLVRFYPPKEN